MSKAEEIMEKALAKLEDVPVGADGVAIPENIPQAAAAAVVYQQSGLTPYKTWQEAYVCMEMGAALGFSRPQVMNCIFVVKGRPCLDGKGMLALIRSHKVCKTIVVGNDGEGDDRCGFVRFERVDTPGQVEVGFTLAEAKKAELGGDAWRKYTDDMLVWRAVARASRRHFSDVTLGIGVKEEARDITRHVTVGRGATLPESTTTDPLLIEAGVVDAVVPEPEAIEPDEVKPALSTACDHSEVEAGRCCVCGELVKPELEVSDDAQGKLL